MKLEYKQGIEGTKEVFDILAGNVYQSHINWTSNETENMDTETKDLTAGTAVDWCSVNTSYTSTDM